MYPERFAKAARPASPRRRARAARVPHAVASSSTASHAFGAARAGRACSARSLAAAGLSARHARRRSSSCGRSGCRRKCSSPFRIVTSSSPCRASCAGSSGSGGSCCSTSRMRGRGPRRAPEETGSERTRPGIVVSIATAGDLVQWHPHGHLLITDGGFSDDGASTRSRPGTAKRSMKLFRERLLARLIERHAISEELARQAPRLAASGLLGPCRRGDPLRGQEGHRGRRVLPRQEPALAQEARLPRRPEGRALSIPHESLARPKLRGHGPSGVAGAHGRPHPRPRQASHPLLCLLRQPRTRRAAAGTADGHRDDREQPKKRRCSPSWARLISKVFQADPLVCNAAVARSSRGLHHRPLAIRRILDHLGLSPPEKPPPDVREVVRVPVDDEGREIVANPA